MEIHGEGNTQMLTRLEEAGALLHSHLYVHRYPYDWRTKQPVIFRATSQWFADVSQLHEKAVSEICHEVQMIPAAVQNQPE